MLNKKVILLIDDEVITNVVHQHMLEQLEDINKVYTVTNGTDAIDLLKHLTTTEEALPDIIFVDINMPLMNGFQFIESIKSMPEFHSILDSIMILSSSLHQTDRERARSLGIKVYVEKPLDDEQIRQCLNARV